LSTARSIRRSLKPFF